MEKKVKKKTTCLKCKKVFETEVDPQGIPYKKICRRCKKNRTPQNRGILFSSPNFYS